MSGIFQYKMPRVHRIAACLFLLITVTACTGTGALEPEMRYRGGYTLAHEVNAFCPGNSSQCFWLAPETPDDVRTALSAVADPLADDPYAATCIVIAAEVDTASPRDGFALDYEGLIDVRKVYGRCEDVPFVTQGDVSHHRWIAALPEGFSPALTPELDFGQRVGRGVFVSGNDGCHEFSAMLLLRGSLVQFSALEMGVSNCLKRSEEPAFDPRETGSLLLRDGNRLQFTTSTTVILFNLRDWVT